MLHDLLLLTTTLFDIYKYINFKTKKKVITQKGPNECNYAPHPSPTTHVQTPTSQQGYWYSLSCRFMEYCRFLFQRSKCLLRFPLNQYRRLAVLLKCGLACILCWQDWGWQSLGRQVFVWYQNLSSLPGNIDQELKSKKKKSWVHPLKHDHQIGGSDNSHTCMSSTCFLKIVKTIGERL